MIRKFSVVLVLCAMLLLMQGCFGSEDDGAVTHEGETVSQEVSAIEGGVVNTPSGAASIDIPAGALAEDTTITVTSLGTEGQPDAENLGSDVYEFGPDGTEFLTPATLSLVLNVESVPDKMKAVLAVLEGETWTTIEGSTIEGNTVSAQITHFSKYSIHFVGDDAVIESEDEVCKDLEFSPCGGDIIGTWKIISMCTSRTVIGENPFGQMPSCADDTFEINLDWVGNIVFKEDGTYTNTMATEMSMHMELTDECLGEIANGASTDYQGICASLSDEEDGDMSCSYESGLCKCNTTPETKPIDDSPDGTYSVDGNNLILDDNDDEPETLPFCVDGKRIVLEVTDDEGNASYFVSEKE